MLYLYTCYSVVSRIIDDRIGNEVVYMMLWCISRQLSWIFRVCMIESHLHTSYITNVYFHEDTPED
jgi:hypothetical protein